MNDDEAAVVVAPLKANGSSHTAATTASKKTMLVLCSGQSLSRELVANQEKAFTILQACGIPFTTLDGAAPENKDRRNELFDMSGIRAKYPQFFILHEDENGATTTHSMTTFWGNWDTFEYANEEGTLAAEFFNISNDSTHAVNHSSGAAVAVAATPEPSSSSTSPPAAAPEAAAAAAAAAVGVASEEEGIVPPSAAPVATKTSDDEVKREEAPVAVIVAATTDDAAAAAAAADAVVNMNHDGISEELPYNSIIPQDGRQLNNAFDEAVVGSADDAPAAGAADDEKVEKVEEEGEDAATASTSTVEKVEPEDEVATAFNDDVSSPAPLVVAADVTTVVNEIDATAEPDAKNVGDAMHVQEAAAAAADPPAANEPGVPDDATIDEPVVTTTAATATTTEAAQESTSAGAAPNSEAAVEEIDHASAEVEKVESEVLQATVQEEQSETTATAEHTVVEEKVFIEPEPPATIESSTESAPPTADKIKEEKEAAATYACVAPVLAPFVVKEVNTDETTGHEPAAAEAAPEDVVQAPTDEQDDAAEEEATDDSADDVVTAAADVAPAENDEIEVTQQEEAAATSSALDPTVTTATATADSAPQESAPTVEDGLVVAVDDDYSAAVSADEPADETEVVAAQPEVHIESEPSTTETMITTESQEEDSARVAEASSNVVNDECAVATTVENVTTDPSAEEEPEAMNDAVEATPTQSPESVHAAVDETTEIVDEKRAAAATHMEQDEHIDVAATISADEQEEVKNMVPPEESIDPAIDSVTVHNDEQQTTAPEADTPPVELQESAPAADESTAVEAADADAAVAVAEGTNEPSTDIAVQVPAAVAAESNDNAAAAMENDFVAEESEEAAVAVETQRSAVELDKGLDTAAIGENDRDQVTVQESASSEQGTETILATASQESAPAEVAIEKDEELVVTGAFVPAVSENPLEAVNEPVTDAAVASTLSSTEDENVIAATEDVKSSASKEDAVVVVAEESKAPEEAPGPAPIVNAEGENVASSDTKKSAKAVEEPKNDTIPLKQQDAIIESTQVKDAVAVDTEVIAVTSKDEELGFEIVEPGTGEHKEASRFDEKPKEVKAPAGQEKKAEMPVQHGSPRSPQRRALVLNTKGDLVPAVSPNFGGGAPAMTADATTKPDMSPTTPWQVRLKKANVGRRSSIDNSGLSTPRTSFVAGSTTYTPTTNGATVGGGGATVPAWAVKLKKTGRNIYESKQDGNDNDRKVVTATATPKKDFSSTPLWNTAKLKKTTTVVPEDKSNAATTTTTEGDK
jgi:hypothetical protein